MNRGRLLRPRVVRDRSCLLALAVVLALSGLVSACNDAGGREEVRWRLTEAPEGNRIELQAEFGGSSCTEFDSWAVDQTASHVEVRAVIVRDTGDCTADLVFEEHTVELDEPLGDRPLLGCEPGNDLDADCLEVHAG